MKAKTNYYSLSVVPADMYVKSAVSGAEYMLCSYSFTLAFYADDCGEYEINCKRYSMVGINKHDDLVIKLDGYKQMSIFDY